MQAKRCGFTMIELVFVIVIIGILSSFAIPKLAASKSDAEAAVCVQDVRQLINDITTYYYKVDFETFQNAKISQMTNVTVKAGTKRGIREDGPVFDNWFVRYYCDNRQFFSLVVSRTPEYDYYLRTHVSVPQTPTTKKAAEKVIDDVFGGTHDRRYKNFYF